MLAISIDETTPLNTYSIKSIHTHNNCCPICLCDESDSNNDPYESFSGLDCEHKFHKKCIIPWIKEKGTCPICRCQVQEYDFNIGYEDEPDMYARSCNFEKYLRFIIFYVIPFVCLITCIYIIICKT